MRFATGPFFLLLLGMAAPAVAQTDLAKLRDAFAAAKAECSAHIKEGAIATFVAAAHCFNDAQNEYATRSAFPWMDLERENEAAHLAIAESADAGRLTAAQAAMEDTAADERLKTAIAAKQKAKPVTPKNSDAPLPESFRFFNQMMTPGN